MWVPQRNHRDDHCFPVTQEGENARLREVNSHCISRIRKIEADNHSGLKKQEKSLKARYEQETASLNRKMKVLQENEKKQMRNIRSQQEQHTKACKVNLDNLKCVSKTECVGRIGGLTFNCFLGVGSTALANDQQN